MVEACPEVLEALVVDTGEPEGDGVRLLFVVLRPGAVLDDALRVEINLRVRAGVPTRRVPDAVYAAPALPRAPDGTQHAEAVRRILTGLPWEDAVANPGALRYFVELFNNL